MIPTVPDDRGALVLGVVAVLIVLAVVAVEIRDHRRSRPTVTTPEDPR